MLFQFEGSKYATSLDLNMGYYNIKLCAFLNQKIPVGLHNSPDIFQAKINKLCNGLENKNLI